MRALAGDGQCFGRVEGAFNPAICFFSGSCTCQQQQLEIDPGTSHSRSDRTDKGLSFFELSPACHLTACTMAATRGSDSRPPPPWQSMPAAVLGQCLRTGSRGDHLSALAVSTTCMRAVMAAAPNPLIIVNASDFNLGRRDTTAWVLVMQHLADLGFALRVEADEEEPVEDWHNIPARDTAQVSLQPLLQRLHQKGVRLSRVTRVTCVGVLLDACAPAGLEVVLPNLHHLEAQDCHMRQGVMPLTPCTNLQSLTLTSQRRQHHSVAALENYDYWHHQLLQLAGQTRLTSLSINVYKYPTSFIHTWAGHLTDLHLSNTLADYAGTRRWEAALSYARQSTNLRRLRLGVCDVGEVSLLSSLTHLHELLVEAEMYEDDSDGLVTALLDCAPLTHVDVSFTNQDAEMRPPEQSLADHACSWQQLTVIKATPPVLARLPLHSLTMPLQVDELGLDIQSDQADEIAAATANLARSRHQRVVSRSVAPRVLRQSAVEKFWVAGAEVSIRLSHRAGAGSPAALLQAAAPLVPVDAAVLSLSYRYGAWDGAALVMVQHIMPPTITTLLVQEATLDLSFWRQLPVSFPQLQLILLHYDDNDPDRPTAETFTTFWDAVCQHQQHQHSTSTTTAVPGQQPAAPRRGRMTAARVVVKLSPGRGHGRDSVSWADREAYERGFDEVKGQAGERWGLHDLKLDVGYGRWH